jgi:hypothetical protein
MFRKINNRTLLIIFALLAVLVVAMLVYDRRKGERTFKSELFKIDSAAVSSVTVYPKGKTGEFVKLVKAGKGWEIISGKKTHPADTSVVKSILQVLSHVTPERVAGTGRESWKEFEITDSLGSRIVVEQGNEVSADFRVGKLSFSQDRGMQNYGGNRNMSVKSHVRVAGDDRVYIVDGFLSVMFPENPSQYRNRILCRIDKNQAAKLTFTYPGDSSFVLARNGTGWLINGEHADSAAAENYLGSIAGTTGSEFADDGAFPPVFPFTLRIEGNSMAPVEVYGAIDPGSKKYFLKSALNPASVFGSSTPNLFSQVFPGKGRFSGQPQAPLKKHGR